ncbi:sulfurtransferase TusA family protein [Bacillus paralicheniformis]|uniref:sulfurtransferase TusA family protein n=1 Tax=Bacillus paralicheniformis TaxID=1648923 RepID=UPI002281DA13|nr:sulfurtransferase TusA family protein [Bacillus paralicheniformis]MCY8151868.1 sulfurtransferase TusA family protein [Bacillus paralicheniformis]MCY9421293.1 sulfurtransferase TusA family protein [Bacillus paralicheniformis]MEC0578184.1 sulfurtransferase TusA family protein [Bacillus paralicheniformis]
MNIKSDRVLDAKGLACPMPVVKTKKAINELEPGQVIEVHATDKGSLADIQAWAKGSGHQYLGTTEDGDILKHFLRKAGHSEIKKEKTFPYVIQNEELQKKVEAGERITVVDVREPAEYRLGHIPGAISIPLGELEKRANELNRDGKMYVVCRTGNRSDLAAKQLAANGFKDVVNVVRGMEEWSGPMEKGSIN